jgi:hypothetical protein
MTLDDIPDVITPEWWQAHEGLLDLDRRSGRLSVRPSATIVPSAEPSA